MLIPDVFTKWDIHPIGIVHIGASYCQERDVYEKTGCDDTKVIWIEADPSICDHVWQNMPSVKLFQGVISDEHDKDVNFCVTNNQGQSSSFLELKEHKREHPEVFEVRRVQLKTTTLPILLEKNAIDISQYDFLAMDIQGAELHALRGMGDTLNSFKYVYLEVNTKELYAGCGLLHDIIDHMSSYGFTMKDIQMTQWGWGDALFIKTSV